MLRRYAGLFDQRALVLPVAAAAVGRVSSGMVPLAIVLVAADELGSYSTAGAATGAFAICGGLLAPLRGRLVDRRGAFVPLIAMATAHAAALLALAVAASMGDAIGAVVFAAAAGATVPPLAAAVRTLWTKSIEAERLTTAYACEAVTQEAAFVVGPMIVGVLAAAAGAIGALAAAAAVAWIGCVGFATSPAVRGWPTSRQRAAGRIVKEKPLLVLLLSVGLGSLAFGALEVALPAAAQQIHGSVEAGVLLALLSVGAIIGGLAYGAVPHAQPARQRYGMVTAGFAFGLVPLALAGEYWQLAGAALIGGLSSAPVLTVVYELLDDMGESRGATELTTWVTTANLAGVAAGALSGGLLVEWNGTSAAFAGAVLAALSACAVALALRPLRA